MSVNRLETPQLNLGAPVWDTRAEAAKVREVSERVAKRGHNRRRKPPPNTSSCLAERLNVSAIVACDVRLHAATAKWMVCFMLTYRPLRVVRKPVESICPAISRAAAFRAVMQLIEFGWLVRWGGGLRCPEIDACAAVPEELIEGQLEISWPDVGGIVDTAREHLRRTQIRVMMPKR